MSGMIRSTPVLLLAGVFALVALAASLVLVGPSASAPAPDAVSVAAAQDLDSARAELEIGRYWHAARHLRALRADGLAFGPEEILLLARADAGWRNWDAVAEALAGQEWLAEVEGGLGLRLLGEAYEAGEAWDDAAFAYALYLSSTHGRAARDRVAVRARRARALRMADESEEALSTLESVAAESSVVASWQALEVARSAASSGDTALVRRLAGVLSDAEARGRGWRLEASSMLAAGDTSRAVDLYEDLSRSEEEVARRAVALDVLGALALARGDTASAVAHSRSAVDVAPNAGGGVAAARRLLDLGSLGADRALVAGQALARSGAEREALAAYDLHVGAVESVTEEVRLARARLMANVTGRHDDAVTEFRALSTSEDPDIGAGALESWIALRRSQGRAGDVRTLQGWLVERYPASLQAVDRVFLRGDAAHDRGELDTALGDYARLQEVAPSTSRAGLARMRMAQIHVTRGDDARALDVFRDYLSEFPEGRRWPEAAYWAGKILLERDHEEGARHLRSVIEREPLSYYAVLAAEALGVPWELPGEAEGGTPPLPEWMESELETVDLLAAAGLEEGRSSRTAALVERALGTSPDAALRLAGELIRRDHSLDGINLGFELRRQGMPWSRALLEVTFPLPHREMVYRAARERDLDPILVAALIRQESAFDPDIVSRAGAVGLMQIMPETGRQLAAAVGPSDFNVESLETPEINLHLGTRYLVDLLERFDGSLPLVLSAYNAGPHRAQAWMSFPEAEDPLRFTERIPYGETRDYVKLVTRNMALYRGLYGDRPAS